MLKNYGIRRLGQTNVPLNGIPSMSICKKKIVQAWAECPGKNAIFFTCSLYG